MISKTFKVSLILLLLCLVLASCVKTEVNDTEVPIIEESPTNIYPIGDSTDPENNTGSQLLPTPSSGTSVYSGSLFSAGDDLPARLVKIYFATKIFLTPGPGYMLSYEEKGSPQIQTDENGYFVITDIEPGEYFLIMVTPVNSYSVIDDQGNQVTFVAEAGKTYDLGKLFVNWP